MVDGSTNDAAPDQARRLIDSGDAPPSKLLPSDHRALAWALKDLCYSAWSSDPKRAADAARALRDLNGLADEAIFATDEGMEARALAEWTNGIACLTQAQMTEAVQSFDLAARIFESLGQAHHAAETQVPKIIALSMLGAHAEAADCADKTQREFVAHGDIRAAGRVSLNLGSLQLRRDAYPSAARHYREAAALFARVGDREHSVMADIGVADTMTAMGDIDEALRMYARARMRAGTHGFPVLEALTEESIALLDLARGRYREALAGLEGSRRRYEKLAMPQHLAIAEKQLGDAYLELRLLPEALRLFDRALSAFATLAMPDDEAWTWTQRGRALRLLDEQGTAEESFVRAAALFAKQGNRVGESAVALARAELALARGEGRAAAELSRSARDGFLSAQLVEGQARADVVHGYSQLALARIDAARHLFGSVLERARSLGFTTIEVRCLTGLGLAARASGDERVAMAELRAAIDLFEEQRRALPGDEIRSAFLADHLRPYRELLEMTLEVHDRRSTPETEVEVLQQVDRYRARGLGERLVEPRDEGDDLEAEGLRTRLSWLYRRVQRLQEEGEPTGNFAGEARRVEGELLERSRRERLVGVDGGRAPNDAKLDAEALQSALRDDEALIEYGVSGDELFACVVTRSCCSLHRRIARWSEVLPAVQSARFQIETLRHGTTPIQKHLARLTERAQLRMNRLHALLWAPLEDALSVCKRVLIVPHAQLACVPFAALHDGSGFLAEERELAMAASARLALRGFSRQLDGVRHVLAIGESTRLPWAAEEARFVATLVADAKMFVGAEATLENLRRFGGSADVLHLACHAQFRSDNPMFSALHLYDGALTAEAAEKLALRPGIVVLSGCETALAQESAGDEMLGLARAFLVAGASRVLASLWPIHDEVAHHFMELFYGDLSRGQSPSASLRAAQLGVIRYNPHPFYWSPFTLQGGW